MDELIHLEILGRHGEVVSRHAVRHLPIRIGRAYDNDLILDDPYVAPHHAVVERSPDGALALVDVGSQNGLYRAGSAQRLTRERLDAGARYRAGRTEFHVRTSSHPVPAERIDTDAGRQPVLVACATVLCAAAMVLLDSWAGTSERIELAKLALESMAVIAALFVWAGAWELSGRLLTGERRFAAHLTVAALILIGFFVADSFDYPAFALSAPVLRHVAVVLLAAVLAWGLWRHLALVARRPGRGIAFAAVIVASGAVGGFALYVHAERAEDLARMEYFKAIKPPIVRLAQGSEVGEFFRDAEQLRIELKVLGEE